MARELALLPLQLGLEGHGHKLWNFGVQPAYRKFVSLRLAFGDIGYNRCIIELRRVSYVMGQAAFMLLMTWIATIVYFLQIDPISQAFSS